MTKLQSLQAEIETLTNDEFIRLKNWINEREFQQLEKDVINSDLQENKLDLEEALSILKEAKKKSEEGMLWEDFEKQLY